jgi:hypothetical protein
VTAHDEGTPLVRVRQGNPTDYELAAVVAVLARVDAAARAARAASAAQDSGAAGVWTDRASLLRRQVTPGPGAWRFSATPHS